MDKIVGEFDKCDECESLVDVYVEFHSRRGDFVKVCMNCLASAIVRPTQHALDAATVTPKCTTDRLCPVHNVWHAAPPRK